MSLFNEVYAVITDFCGITLNKIYNATREVDWVNKNTISGWRTRGIPRESYFDILCGAIKDILCADVHKVEYCKTHQGDLKGILEPIWLKHSAPVVRWDESRDVIENILEILKDAYYLSKLPKPADAKEEIKNAKRLVAFDLDGTLIKGFRYSWTIAFKAIGSTGKEAVKFKEDFEFGKITYPDWCRSDCEILSKGGLTFEKVKEEVKKSGASLTKNLVEAITKLKANGCKVAIISGGADSVLYSLLPNANELFDEIFINKLVYNKDTGILEKIIPTLYDWDRYGNGVEGKQAGFKLLCERYGAKPEDSVFVGDDFNDVGAMEMAGMKIFYYSYSQYDPTRGLGRRPEIRKIPSDAIHEPGNDLMRVANRILKWDFGDMDYIE